MALGLLNSRRASPAKRQSLWVGVAEMADSYNKANLVLQHVQPV